MPRVRMSPAWFGGLDVTDDNEWIDTEQRGLVLRVRRGRLVWFVRYLFEGEARRYRIGARDGPLGCTEASIRRPWPGRRRRGPAGREARQTRSGSTTKDGGDGQCRPGVVARG